MYWTLGKVDSVTVYNLNDKCRGAKRSGDRYVGKGKKSYGNEKISWKKVTIKIGPLT